MLLTKKQVCDRLGISAATLQRRMVDGSIKYSKGEGRLDFCYFDEAQFQVVPVVVPDSPKTEPLGASESNDNKVSDHQRLPESTEKALPADYGHSLELSRLDEWTTGALKDARLQWMLPARTDGYGVPTNQPHKDSSTMPSPEHAALWARAGAILQERSAKNGEIPRHTLRKPHGYWPSDPAIANHNNRVATLGQADTTEECHAWVRNQGMPSSNGNPLRQIPQEIHEEKFSEPGTN
jgi:hypothetical protein